MATGAICLSDISPDEMRARAGSRGHRSRGPMLAIRKGGKRGGRGGVGVEGRDAVVIRSKTSPSHCSVCRMFGPVVRLIVVVVSLPLAEV